VNVIGIEWRRTYTVVALREGQHAPRLVGDGRRTVIPNAVGPGGAWGSDAALDGIFADWFGIPPAGPWTGALVEEFWQRLHDRLTRFLGVLDPAAAGYRTLIATPRLDRSPAAVAVAQSAGFAGATAVTPTEAVVAGWLFQQGKALEQERTVAVVTVGDVSAEAAVYYVQTGAEPAIIASADGGVLEGTGCAYWTDRIIRAVESRLPEQLPAQLRLRLWQAAREFGARLRRSAPDIPIHWNGPLEDRLIDAVSVSADDFAEWPEVAALFQWAPSALGKAVKALGRSAPDVLLVAGAGADWPLPAVFSKELPPSVITDFPAADVARGAAWHPELRPHSRRPRATPSFAQIEPEKWSPPPPPPPPELYAPPPPISSEPPGLTLFGKLRPDELTRLLEEDQNELKPPPSY
jgi:hypothetical protein